MKKISVITGILACLISLPLHAADQPSLEETLSWLDNTYNTHTGGSWGHGSVLTRLQGEVLKQEDTSFKYNGCKMVVTNSVQHFQKPDGLSSEFENEYTFALKDIDPNSIVLHKFESRQGGIDCSLDPTVQWCDAGELDFKTKNEQPLIREKLLKSFLRGVSDSDKAASPITQTAGSYFILLDQDYAYRFMKAFKHAIILCGGTPSTF